MKRALEQYAGCSPDAIASGSKAQMIYFVEDAKADIALLAEQLDEARLERDEAITDGQDRIADLGAELDQAAGFIEIHKAESARLLTHNASLREALQIIANGIDENKELLERGQLQDIADSALAGNEPTESSAATATIADRPGNTIDPEPVAGDAPTMTAEQMREAAAKVAEDYDGDGMSGSGYSDQLGDAYQTRREIAELIRALSPASPGKGGE